jgi:hypothetical protein
MSVDTQNTTATAIADPSRVRVAGAIKQAANSTGASFEYLLATAKMESDFKPAAGASTSSAHGLFQFIEQTWLGTVKEAGAQFGYGQYADSITRSASGEYSVSNPGARKAIMELRDEPAASSAMAGVLTQSNSFKLTGMIGRRPTDAELYMAHFMGVGSAAKLISNAEDNPRASGARLFPNAAAANRSVFYDRSGSARSVSEVYSELTSRYASAASSPAIQSALAMYGGSPGVSVASAAPVALDSATYLSSFPNVRPVTPLTVATAASTANPPTATDPIFRSLFQVDERSQPVSSTVRELWGKSSSLTSVASSAPDAQTPSSGERQGLDLFSDRSGAFSG